MSKVVIEDNDKHIRIFNLRMEYDEAGDPVLRCYVDGMRHDIFWFTTKDDKLVGYSMKYLPKAYFCVNDSGRIIIDP